MVVMSGPLAPARHLHDRLGGLRSSTSVASLRVLREFRRRLIPPRLRDEHLEIFDRHGIQSYKDS
jgi:ribosomal protein S18 acetylase RimI-like enzyme